jgi:hypothetical protein
LQLRLDIADDGAGFAAPGDNDFVDCGAVLDWARPVVLAASAADVRKAEMAMAGFLADRSERYVICALSQG